MSTIYFREYHKTSCINKPEVSFILFLLQSCCHRRKSKMCPMPVITMITIANPTKKAIYIHIDCHIMWITFNIQYIPAVKVDGRLQSLLMFSYYLLYYFDRNPDKLKRKYIKNTQHNCTLLYIHKMPGVLSNTSLYFFTSSYMLQRATCMPTL